MAMDERYNLVLAFARVLFINGQATEQTVAAAERLGRRLGLRVKLMPRWGGTAASVRRKKHRCG
jgi:uncharacterized membrane protein YjjP (DUF1212 family)